MGKKYTNFKVNLDGLDSKSQWYTVVTQYNYEQYVVNSINKIIEENKSNPFIFEAFSGIVVTEQRTVNKKGVVRTKVKNEKVIPNYVFVKTIMNVDTWNLLTNLTGVSAILCTSGVPVATTDTKIAEIKNWLEQTSMIGEI